jgi:hypothetical protein
MEQCWNDINEAKPNKDLDKIPVPVPLRPPQIEHELLWA